MSMRNIYRKIAKEHGVTVEEVKREMQKAIDSAYKKNDKLDSEKMTQAGVPHKGDVPTTEELINAIANKIKTDTI